MIRGIAPKSTPKVYFILRCIYGISPQSPPG
uniref:Uncharacterized protein n=1 Tax=Pseudomonas phage Baskent_P1_112 TaxID=3145032 RepID=A0AAU8B8Z5_9CAUD